MPPSPEIQVLYHALCQVVMLTSDLSCLHLDMILLASQELI